MAFNLNKNEATNSPTKFDLSKSSSSTGSSAAQEKSKSKTWLLALLGLLAIGITAWYLLSTSNNISENKNSVASAATSSDSANIPPAGNQNKATIAPVITTSDLKTENESNSTTSATSDNTNANPGDSTSTGLATAISGTDINNRVPATFAKGSNSISGLDASLVKDIIAFLEKNPSSIINVNGYASSEGSLAVNQTISQSRADAFKRYLVAKGISDNRIKATGKGINNPISSNDMEAGRIQNRRVEISLQ